MADEKKYIEVERAINAACDGADEWDGGPNHGRDVHIAPKLRCVPAADVRLMEWISVKDRLPETDCKVLAYSGFDHGDGDLGMMFMGVLDYYAYDEKPHFQHAGTGLIATHWMPLPEPPLDTDTREVMT